MLLVRYSNLTAFAYLWTVRDGLQRRSFCYLARQVQPTTILRSRPAREVIFYLLRSQEVHPTAARGNYLRWSLRWEDHSRSRIAAFLASLGRKLYMRINAGSSMPSVSISSRSVFFKPLLPGTAWEGCACMGHLSSWMRSIQCLATNISPVWPFHIE